MPKGKRSRTALKNCSTIPFISPDDSFIQTNGKNILLPEKSNNILNSITWFEQTITDGFVLPDEHIAFMTQYQVFERLHNQSVPGNKPFKGGISLQELSHLNIGDFVVHAHKGIGKFNGFKTVQLGDSLQDCVRLTFAGDDILDVHLNYIHKLQKILLTGRRAAQIEQAWFRRMAEKKISG